MSIDFSVGFERFSGNLADFERFTVRFFILFLSDMIEQTFLHIPTQQARILHLPFKNENFSAQIGVLSKDFTSKNVHNSNSDP